MDTETKEPLVTLWQERRTKAESVQTPLYKKFKDYYDQFYAVIRNMNSPWRSKLYMPEFFTVIMTKAAIITAKPLSWDVSGRTDEDIATAKMIEEIMAYQVREPHVRPGHHHRFLTAVLDALVTGTSVSEVPFKMQTDSFKRYPTNELTGRIDTSKVELTKRMARWNEFIPIEHTRFFKDPYSTSVQDAQWIIVEDFQTAHQLRAKNAQNPGYYNNLKDIDRLQGANDTLGAYNTSRNSLMKVVDKVSEDQTVKYLRIWRCYERKYDLKTGEPYIEYGEIAGETQVIRSPRRLDFWHNQFPFAVLYDYNRPHEFWGVGEIEVNESIVKGVNDNVNQFFDNKNLSNNTMIMRRASTILEPFIIEPGGEVIYDGEAPTQFKFADPDGQSFLLAHNALIQALERSSGVSGYVAGVPSAGIDKTRGTKGGIEQITANANNRFGYTQRQVGDFLEQIGRIWLSNIQQFFTEDFMVRLTSGEMRKFTPEEIQGEFDVFVTDNSLTPSNRQEKLDMLLQLFGNLDKLAPMLAAEGKSVRISQSVQKFLGLMGENRPEELIVDMPPKTNAEPKRNVAITFVGNELPKEVQAELLAEQFDTGNDPATLGEENVDESTGALSAPGAGSQPDELAAAIAGMGSNMPGDGQGAPAFDPTFGGA